MFSDEFEIDPDAVVGLAVVGVVGFVILVLGMVYKI